MWRVNGSKQWLGSDSNLKNFLFYLRFYKRLEQAEVSELTRLNAELLC